MHHDLKPQNMVVNEDSKEVVIVDLGTALSTKDPKEKLIRFFIRWFELLLFFFLRCDLYLFFGV